MPATMPNEHPALVEVRKLLDIVRMVECQMQNVERAERAACTKALTALAGAHLVTPQEGYGTNTSWAMDDLCKGIRLLQDRLQNAMDGNMVGTPAAQVRAVRQKSVKPK